MNTHAIAELDALTASNAMEVAEAKYLAARAEFDAAAKAEAMTPKGIAKTAYNKAKKDFDEKKTKLDKALAYIVSSPKS